MLGKRIKQARTAAGLSLRDLAEKIGITATAISKYERDEINPSSKVLISLGKALNVRNEYFFRQTEVALSDPDYRQHVSLSDKAKDMIHAEVLEQIERWLELEEFSPTPWSVEFKIPNNLPSKISTYDQLEEVAIKLRHEWELGLNPISDLIDTLESRGLKVFFTQYDGGNKFFGLAVKANGMPVVVVSKRSPGDRQRFTLAHELGHLILKGRLSEDLDEELACNRFAGAFLAPNEKVFEALSNSRTRVEIRELMLLKQEWGLSMQAWIYRAFDLGIISKNNFGKMFGYFRKRGWNLEEPVEYPREKTILFDQIVYRALGENKIGESKAAELLGKGLIDFHAYRNVMDGTDASNNH